MSNRAAWAAMRVQDIPIYPMPQSGASQKSLAHHLRYAFQPTLAGEVQAARICTPEGYTVDGVPTVYRPVAFLLFAKTIPPRTDGKVIHSRVCGLEHLYKPRGNWLNIRTFHMFLPSGVDALVFGSADRAFAWMLHPYHAIQSGVVAPEMMGRSTCERTPYPMHKVA